MMTLPDSRFKGVYSALLRLKIEEYLISNEFSYLCLELDIDQIWSECKRAIHSQSSVAVLVPGYTGYAKDALLFFLEILFSQHKNQFNIIISKILNDFQLWKKQNIDYSRVYEKLNEIGIIITPISKLTEIIENSKNDSTDEHEESTLSKDIFIAHGHDNELKLEVERILYHLELNPIILHRQPDQGQVTIEKFEKHSETCNHAIILLSPDDVGAKNSEDDIDSDLLTRARQNVIFEMGYFFGKLGRDKVIVLNKGVDELPSDYIGILYKPVNSSNNWRMDLINALIDQGYHFTIVQISKASR